MEKNETLIIDNVNFNLLEEQRVILSQIVCGEISDSMTPEQREALEGILFMLDAWSDKRLEDAMKRNVPIDEFINEIEDAYAICFDDELCFGQIDYDDKEAYLLIGEENKSYKLDGGAIITLNEENSIFTLTIEGEQYFIEILDKKMFGNTPTIDKHIPLEKITP